MDILLELSSRQKQSTRLLVVIGAICILPFIHNNFVLTVLLATAFGLCLENPTHIYTFVSTVNRDVIALIRFIRLNIFLYKMERRKWSLARMFQEICREEPEKLCFIMDEKQWSFQDLENYSNKVAVYFLSKGYQHGDCIALLMETRAEYVALWLGLAKIGVITALINSNLKRETLLHSIQVAKSKAIIVGSELVNNLKDILDKLNLEGRNIYQYSDEDQRKALDFCIINGATDLTEDLNKPLNSDMKADLNNYIEKCQPRDKLLYVYTSGTTGLPKAAVITNSRYLFMTAGTHYMASINKNDIIYNPLPLYHTAGGIVGVGNALIFGCTIALRKRFSASNFWKDCIRYNATVAQYIGELCRYLLATPCKPEDTQHQLRLMYGNGLRAQIWSQFVSRFHIPNIVELYGSTEGNSNLANINNQVGAIGFVPNMARFLYPIQLVQCDENTGEPVRDDNGFCKRCNAGEAGLLIGRVDAKRAVTAFHGYADKVATEKKLLRNVFKEGDLYFNSGDLMVSDILGYYYFKDRTGDTFRWRGENVSTQEVEAIISSIIGLQDCVVYGIEIPHVEGKAGMAAIEDPERKVNIEHLSVGIRGSLPTYAQPLFLRIMNQIPRTETFKMKKRDLVSDGFDLTKITDALYYLNKDGVYRSFTSEQYNALLNGSAGL